MPNENVYAEVKAITKFKPHNDGVVIKPCSVQEKIGSFYLPEIAKGIDKEPRERGWRGELVSWGSKVFIEGFRFKKGKVVWLSGTCKDCPRIATDEDGEKTEYVLVKDVDILAEETNGN